MNNNLKWLLLIPVVIVAVVMGFLIPKLIGGGSGDGEAAGQQQNQALDLDITGIQESIEGYQGLLARNPGDPDALLGLANRYLELGPLQRDNNDENAALVSFKAAIDNFRQYLAVKPGDSGARIDLGLAYFYLQMPDIAERELKAATQADPGNQRAWLSYGFVISKLLKTDQARAAFETAIKIDPNSPMAQEARAMLDELAVPQAGSLAP